MSEQENTQTQTPQEQVQLIGGKFKSQDDLLKSYQELERKLHQRTNTQQTPAEPPATSKEPEPSWKQKSAALDAEQAFIDKRKGEASKLLNDTSVLVAVRGVLGSRDAIAAFERDLEAGLVSAAEIKRLIALSGKAQEATTTLPEPDKDTSAGVVTDAEKAYLFAQLKPGSAYNSTNSPNHASAVEKVQAIKHKLGMD